MRRLLSPIGVGLMLLVAACGSQRSVEPVALTPSHTPVSNASETTTPIPVESRGDPLPTAGEIAATPGAVAAEEQATVTPEPLQRLSPSAADTVERAGYRVGVAVLDLDSEQAYLGGDEGRFALASVSKLAITVGVLHRAESEDRELTSEERGQLKAMLSESQNTPAVNWWADLGSEGVNDALVAYGLSRFWMPPDDQWGDMAATAMDVAKLVQLFVDKESPLRPSDREFVLSLMESVVQEQRWGVSAGVDLSSGADTVLAIKNGWYPQDGAWRVNSAGAISLGGHTDHVVVVLSDGADDFYRGVRVVEEVAAAVNAALYPRHVLVALPPFVRPAQEVPAEGGAAEDVPEAPAATPSAEVADQVEFVALRTADDVLVLAGRMLNSAESDESLAVWFEVPTAEVSEVMDAYVASMRALGWATISGPPDVVLSKPDQGRFVAVTPRAGGAGGSQIIEFRVAPVPEATVGAAAID